MIQVNELMGNYFIGYDNKIFKWDLVHFDLLITSHSKIDEIIKEPIPITEEWLLKFGFRESETDLRKGNIIVRFGEDRLIVTIIDELVLPKIQYIHQLQNLYFAHHNQELT